MRNKGFNLAGFPLYRDIVRLNVPRFHQIKEPLKKDSLSADEQILNEIYRINPVTGLPEGDLAIYMSENTSPEIRDYIQRNLLTPNEVNADASGMPDLDDDTILELTRRNDESSVSYSTRVFEYLKGIRKSELASKKKESDS